MRRICQGFFQFQEKLFFYTFRQKFLTFLRGTRYNFAALQPSAAVHLCKYIGQIFLFFSWTFQLITYLTGKPFNKLLKKFFYFPIDFYCPTMHNNNQKERNLRKTKPHPRLRVRTWLESKKKNSKVVYGLTTEKKNKCTQKRSGSSYPLFFFADLL